MSSGGMHYGQLGCHALSEHIGECTVLIGELGHFLLHTDPNQGRLRSLESRQAQGVQNLEILLGIRSYSTIIG